MRLILVARCSWEVVIRSLRKSCSISTMIGQGSDRAKETALELIRVLNLIQETHDLVSMASMLETGKKQAKQDLANFKIGGSFVASYCFLVAVGGHAIPLTGMMIDTFPE